MRFGFSLAASAAGALLLAGCSPCTVEYGADPDLPASYSFAGSADPASAAIDRWWEQFGDPVLNRLVADALRDSPDLAAARERYEKARHEAAVRGADLGPSAALSLQTVGGRIPAGDTPAVLDHSQARRGLLLGGGVSWEPDIFGEKRSQADAAVFSALSRRDEAVAARTALAARVAENYFALLELRERLDLTRRRIQELERLEKYVRGRFSAGQALASDVEDTAVRLSAARALIPQLEAGSDCRRRILAALAGRAPQSFNLEDPLPFLPRSAPAVPGGMVPGDLLLRRPDLRACQNRIRALAAMKAAAQADLYPRFGISFLGGYGALRLGGIMGSSDGWFSLLTGSVSAPIFTNGRIRENIEARGAELREAARDFESRILGALRDVENAYSRMIAQQRRRSLLEEELSRADRLAAAAFREFELGAKNFDAAAAARMQVLSCQGEILDSRLQELNAGIDLFTALGGGWDPGELTGEDGAAGGGDPAGKEDYGT